MTNPENHRNPWTPPDKAHLLEMFEQGYDATVIAHSMGRTVAAIIGQLEKMDKVVNEGGKVYKKELWLDARCVPNSVNLVNLDLTIGMLERVKALGGVFRVDHQWQDDHPEQPDDRKFRFEYDLIKFQVGADLGGWLAVSQEFRDKGSRAAEDGRPVTAKFATGVDAVAEWLGVPTQVAEALLGAEPVGYHDKVYDKHPKDVTIDDTIAALRRLRDTGDPSL